MPDGTDTESVSLSDWQSIPPFSQDSEPGEFVVRETGDWSRTDFGHQILHIASTLGDDAALAQIANTFPRVTLENARLWLTYLKDVQNTGGAFDSFIMDTFRQLDWCQVLRSPHSADIAPELFRLLPDALQSPPASQSPPGDVDNVGESVYNSEEATHPACEAPESYSQETTCPIRDSTESAQTVRDRATGLPSSTRGIGNPAGLSPAEAWSRAAKSIAEAIKDHDMGNTVINIIVGNISAEQLEFRM